MNIFLHRTQGPGGAFEENRTNCRVALFLRSAHCEFFTLGQIAITSWVFFGPSACAFFKKIFKVAQSNGRWGVGSASPWDYRAGPFLLILLKNRGKGHT